MRGHVKDVATQAEQIAREQELVQRYRSHRKFSQDARARGPAGAAPGGTRRGAAQGTQARDPERRARRGPGRHDRARSSSASRAWSSGTCRDAARRPRTGRRRPSRARSPGCRSLPPSAASGSASSGPNGAGKTTLLRTIAGELPPLDGAHRPSATTSSSATSPSCARRPSRVPPSSRPCSRPSRSRRARPARTSPVSCSAATTSLKEVRALSGGERSRLELALLGIQPSNLLLLDEPTNHLDIPAREAIEAFMAGSPATLLVVSHDRRLLETVCEKLWVVDDGAAAPFDGGYRAWRAAVAAGWTVASAMEAEAKRLHVGSRNPGGATATALASAATTGGVQRHRAIAADPGSRPGHPTQGSQAREALEGRVSTAADRAGRRADPSRPSQEPPGARDGRSRRRRELRRAAAGHERARRRRGGTRGGRGRLAGAGGAGAMTVRIGLTGPIGCGKTTVAEWLGELPNVVVIDADRVARQVVEPGEPALDDDRRAVRRSPAPSGRIARPGGPRADRLRRPGRASRPGGDRPPRGPAADPGDDRSARTGTARRRSSSRRSSSSKAASPRCATRSGWSHAIRSTSSGASGSGACPRPRPTTGSPSRET